ncbi:MAG: DUF1643 domain-containing protein [Hyphomicrobiaceae bacterium]|nr:MAG: DUF1643 domain-containing protein [Hyphomicrobiaceae bacterium]
MIIVPAIGDDVLKRHADPSVIRYAIFSRDLLRRYLLFHSFVTAPERIAAAVMLNPSTADEMKNDPTVERVERRFQRLGFDAYFILNLFAFRATDPDFLSLAKNPIGENNDWYIMQTVQRPEVELVLCGWGMHGERAGRDEDVFKHILAPHANKVRSLGVTSWGHPRHPLYVSYKTEPTPFILRHSIPRRRQHGYRSGKSEA